MCNLYYKLIIAVQIAYNFEALIDINLNVTIQGFETDNREKILSVSFFDAKMRRFHHHCRHSLSSMQLMLELPALDLFSRTEQSHFHDSAILKRQL